jgi:hypothetical protein
MAMMELNDGAEEVYNRFRSILTNRYRIGQMIVIRRE